MDVGDRDRIATYVYPNPNLDEAIREAEIAIGEDPGRIYILKVMLAGFCSCFLALAFYGYLIKVPLSTSVAVSSAPCTRTHIGSSLPPISGSASLAN